MTRRLLAHSTFMRRLLAERFAEQLFLEVREMLRFIHRMFPIAVVYPYIGLNILVVVAEFPH